MTPFATPPPGGGRRPLTLTEWLICTVAALGFAFDIYELLMLPLIVRPAMLDLAGFSPGTSPPPVKIPIRPFFFAMSPTPL